MVPKPQTARKTIVGPKASRGIPTRPEVKRGHKALPSTVQSRMPVKTTKPTTPIQANPQRREAVRRPKARRGQAHSIIL